MAKFFSLMGSYLNVDKLHHLAQVFPHTLYRAKKFVGRLHENFIRFVTCPSCHKLYKYEDCITTDISSKKVSRVCSYVRYPNHIGSS